MGHTLVNPPAKRTCRPKICRTARTKNGLQGRLAAAGGINPSIASTSNGDYWRVKAYKYQRSNNSDPLGNFTVLDEFGDPTLIEVSLPDDVIGNPNSSMNAVEDDNMERYAYNLGLLVAPYAGRDV